MTRVQPPLATNGGGGDCASLGDYASLLLAITSLDKGMHLSYSAPYKCIYYHSRSITTLDKGMHLSIPYSCLIPYSAPKCIDTLY